MTAAIEQFETQRPRMRALAYRMLGSYSEAEDVVQDAWLRWHAIDADDVENPRAYLARVVTRLCLDRIGAARNRHEHYVGPWLPDPLPDDSDWLAPDPQTTSELASDVSYALLLSLERLSAAERAAFLLHDVFDLDFGEVAASLGRSEAACRQLASRARRQVRSGGTRFRPAPESQTRLLQAFIAAVDEHNVEKLTALLAEDARYISDSGGRVAAPRRPVTGAVRIAKALVGFARKHRPPEGLQMYPARLNGLPGIVMFLADDSIVQTMSLEPDETGRIRAIYNVRNPDKLRHLAASRQVP